ncbi:MAG: hypothetical protein QOI10_3798 [Solirubrobacterales bacterium]|jgi:hypothetical protein|nr:hypothetical protein [Solirubrobacterales bacterium]
MVKGSEPTTAGDQGVDVEALLVDHIPTRSLDMVRRAFCSVGVS